MLVFDQMAAPVLEMMYTTITFLMGCKSQGIIPNGFSVKTPFNSRRISLGQDPLPLAQKGFTIPENPTGEFSQAICD
jgi:hypothetical protein